MFALSRYPPPAPSEDEKRLNGSRANVDSWLHNSLRFRGRLILIIDVRTTWVLNDLCIVYASVQVSLRVSSPIAAISCGTTDPGETRRQAEWGSCVSYLSFVPEAAQATGTAHAQPGSHHPESWTRAVCQTLHRPRWSFRYRLRIRPWHLKRGLRAMVMGVLGVRLPKRQPQWPSFHCSLGFPML